MPESTVADRLEKVRNVMGFPSLKRFYDHIEKSAGETVGARYAAVTKYHSTDPDRTREPPLSYLEAVLGAFPDIRPEWLAFGQEPMTVQEEMSEMSVRAGRDPDSPRGRRLLALWDGEEGLPEWRAEAVMRFDDLVEAAGLGGLLGHGGQEHRLVLLRAALRYLHAAEKAIRPSHPRHPKPQDLDEYHERLALLLVVSDPTTRREDYALWADQVLRTFASQVKGLGIPLSLEDRASLTAEMGEKTPEQAE